MLLAVSGLRGDRFGPIDLEVASGEIVGIAGAEGNGQVQFLRALAGAERATGTATCDGKQLDSSSPLGPLRAGVVLLSGDRASESLFPVLSVRVNSTIQVLRRLGRLGLLSRRRERRMVDDLVRRLSIRTASIEQSVQTLSGGNQQKVSLTRPFLRGDVKVILAEEPTQGVDVAARFDIYGALREKAKEGVATIVKSSDPLELAGLCDRVVVMSRGRIVDEIPGDELGERRIVEAIVGSRAGARETATEGTGRSEIVRHEARQVQRRVAARPDDVLIVAARRLCDRPPGRLPHELQPQQPAPPDDAVGFRLAGTDVRPPRRRIRRLGRRRS